MPVEIPQEFSEMHSEMLKLIGSYTQHYNAKTRSNAFNTMVTDRYLFISTNMYSKFYYRK